MGIKKANSDIVAVKIGSTDLSAIYHGSDLVWSGVFEGLKGICTYSQDWTTDTGVHCKIVSSNDDGTYNFEAKCKGNDFNSLLYADTNIIKITSLEAKNAHLYRTFQNCTNITEIDFGENCQTEFSTLFEFANKCSNLQYVRNIGKLKPGSNISDCRNFFNGCKKLKTVDFGGLDLTTNNVADYIFADCNELETVGDISKLVGLGATSNARAIFKNCYKLDGINEYVKQWRVDNVKQIYSLFDGCYALTGELDLSGWNTSNFVSAYAMFKACRSLTSINISGWDLRKVTDLSNMFAGCSALTTIGDNITFDLSACTSVNSMFFQCDKLTSNITFVGGQNLTTMNFFLFNCKNLSSISFNNFDIPNVKIMSYMFYGIKNAIKDFSFMLNWDFSNVEQANNIFEEVEFTNNTNVAWRNFKPKNVEGMFLRSVNANKVIGYNEWDMSRCENVTGVFQTDSIPSINISKWDLSNNKNFTYWLHANTTSIIIGEGIFNCNLGAIPFNGLTGWVNEEEIANMLIVLRDHPKTTADNYDDWEYTQTIWLSQNTWNVIQTSTTLFDGKTLSELMEEATDNGWEISH